MSESRDDLGTASGFSVDEDDDGSFRWRAFGPTGARDGVADSREDAEAAARAAELELNDPSRRPPR
jgi:hypothetical protein